MRRFLPAASEHEWRFTRAREAGDVNAEVRDAVDHNGYSLFQIGLSLSEFRNLEVAGLQLPRRISCRTTEIAARFFSALRNLTFPLAFLNP